MKTKEIKNKDIQTYFKDYYNDNKKRIRENMNRLVFCIYCNENIKKCNLPRHERTKKHSDNIKKNQDVILYHKLKEKFKDQLQDHIKKLLDDEL